VQDTEHRPEIHAEFRNAQPSTPLQLHQLHQLHQLRLLQSHHSEAIKESHEGLGTLTRPTAQACVTMQENTMTP
jgi:hypothetical protein